MKMTNLRERATDLPGRMMTRAQRVPNNNNGTGRPGIRYVQASGGTSGHWRLAFEVAGYDISFETKILHAHPTDAVSVVCWDDGDEREVVTKEEFELHLAAYRAHMPGPDPETALTREEALAAIEGKYEVINDCCVWERVEDCLRRWDAMMYLFCPTIA